MLSIVHEWLISYTFVGKGSPNVSILFLRSVNLEGSLRQEEEAKGKCLIICDDYFIPVKGKDYVPRRRHV